MPIQNIFGLFLDVYLHFVFSPLSSVLGFYLGITLVVKGSVIRMRHVLLFFALMTTWGFGIIAGGFWSVGGETNPTPSYLHGMICVYAFGLGLFTYVIIGVLFARTVADQPWFIWLRNRIIRGAAPERSQLTTKGKHDAS